MQARPSTVAVSLRVPGEPPVVVLVAADVHGRPPAVVVDPRDRLGRTLAGTWLSDENGSPSGRKTTYQLVAGRRPAPVDPE